MHSICKPVVFITKQTQFQLLIIIDELIIIRSGHSVGCVFGTLFEKEKVLVNSWKK